MISSSSFSGSIGFSNTLLTGSQVSSGSNPKGRFISRRMPVIILTARDTLPERVAGLEEGADDYLTKPFAFAELLAHIRARLRSAAMQAVAHATKDNAEAVNAFLEKRKPVFKGD